MQPDSTGTFRDDFSKVETSQELLDSSQTVYNVPPLCIKKRRDLPLNRSGVHRSTQEPELSLTATGRRCNVQQQLFKTLQL